MAQDDGGGARHGPTAAALEWAAAALAALLVAALLGALLREALAARGAGPDLAAVAEAPAETSDGRMRLGFAVENRGGRAASGVSVALDLRGGGAVLERRRLFIDYVPAHSRATGAFYLDRLPDGAAAVVTVEGYVDP